MPQHKKLSVLPLRLPQVPRDLPPSLQAYLQQLYQSLQIDRNAQASIDICSGKTKFDDPAAGYFLGYAKNVTGVPDGTPVFGVGDFANDKGFKWDGTTFTIYGSAIADDVQIASGGNIRQGMTAYLTGTGFWLGDDTGTAKFSVGDSSNGRYLAFDGTDLTIGPNTQFLGVDAINNDRIFRHMIFESLDSYVMTTLGASSIIKQDGQGRGIEIRVDDKSGDYCRFQKPRPGVANSAGLRWDDDMTLVYRLTPTTGSVSGTRMFVGISQDFINGRPDKNHIGFDNSGSTLRGVVSNGSTTATVNIGTWSVGSAYILRADRSATGVTFYVDGAEAGTISSSLPTGILSNNQDIFFLGLEGLASGGNTTRIVISDAYFVQK